MADLILLLAAASPTYQPHTLDRMLARNHLLAKYASVLEPSIVLVLPPDSAPRSSGALLSPYVATTVQGLFDAGIVSSVANTSVCHHHTDEGV